MRGIDSMAADVRACRLCRLSEGRTHVVFGEGPTPARVMLVGEAPGANEDFTGRPFVGAAGEILNQLLHHAGLARGDVYITNVVKCRPPGNRDPRPDERATCRPYLGRQVVLVDPVVVVAMGNHAARSLLGTTAPISSIRGTRFEWGGRTLIPTFHPAAAIYFGAHGEQALREDWARVGESARAETQVHDAEAEPLFA